MDSAVDKRLKGKNFIWNKLYFITDEKIIKKKHIDILQFQEDYQLGDTSKNAFDDSYWR